MSRIVYVEIVGKQYPMSFSLGASKKMIEKFGSVSKMEDYLKRPGKDVEKIDTILDMLELLIAQGCAYKNHFEQDIPAPNDAPIIEGKWTPLPKEALSIGINVIDIDKLADKIKECVTNGGKKEVELKTEGKNVGGVQG